MDVNQTLGHLRLTSKLGDGGMGVVYRAHDERLDRDAAIKVLPENVARDEERLARFEREARAIARLELPWQIFCFMPLVRDRLATDPRYQEILRHLAPSAEL